MTMEECCSTQLIDGEGNFNEAGLDKCMKAMKLADQGLSYAVVSIMGPQISGKSTLLNNLFHTNFREMDAFRGRTQTTQGIWIARATGIDPCTLIMDLEGTDGRGRGEDDTAFEKQSALFALAVSDIVLINMWCHDIGREQAANKPLLKTVFQVMMHLFSPRKRTLLFVIRDKTKTPLEVLETALREDIQKIWDSVPKPPAHKQTPLSEFFNVEVTALSSYEEKEEQFKDQVMLLRQRFVNSIAPGGLAGDRRAVVPASGFPFSTQRIWKIIRENKYLDLPACKVMVATVRCEEIANQILAKLASDEDWLELEEAVQSGPVLRFGQQISSILDKYFSDYDTEAVYFDESVRTTKRQNLESKSLDLVYPAYQAMLGHHRARALNMFMEQLDQLVFPDYQAMLGCYRLFTRGMPPSFITFINSSKWLDKACWMLGAVRDYMITSLAEFDQGCADATVQQATWDSLKTREKLCRDIDNHVASFRATKLPDYLAVVEKYLSAKLSGLVASHHYGCSADPWRKTRIVSQNVTVDAIMYLKMGMGRLLIDDQRTVNRKVENLREYARSVIEEKAREEAGQVLIWMKMRFSHSFCSSHSRPRVWTGKENIQAITKDAFSTSLKLLAVMAALRLEENTDNIESVLSSALLDNGDGSSAIQETSVSAIVSPLDSSTWEEVSPRDTLITPVQCKSRWRQFKTETEYIVWLAIFTQEASRRSSTFLPQPWVIVALLILGFNEFMLLLRNPLYLGVLFVSFLLVKALWVQLDIASIFQHGALSGILQLSTKFLPTVMGILKRLADEGQKVVMGILKRLADEGQKVGASSNNANGSVQHCAFAGSRI